MGGSPNYGCSHNDCKPRVAPRLGRAKHAWGVGWLDQVRLPINALLVKG